MARLCACIINPTMALLAVPWHPQNQGGAFPGPHSLSDAVAPGTDASPSADSLTPSWAGQAYLGVLGQPSVMFFFFPVPDPSAFSRRGV